MYFMKLIIIGYAEAMQ